MAWIADEYAKIYGHTPAVVTGKPLSVGGSLGRSEATGLGLVTSLARWCQLRGESLAGRTAAIQGFGNVGRHAAAALVDRDVRIVALSDSRGAIRADPGLDPAEVARHAEATGSVTGFPDADPMDNDELLALDCDILVPAALGGSVTSANARAVRAAIVVEGANAAVSAAAEDMLADRGVAVLPDILVNAGGVVVSYLEWIQNLQWVSWGIDRVRSAAAERLTRATDVVAREVDQRGCTARQAAYLVAVQRQRDAVFAAGP